MKFGKIFLLTVTMFLTMAILIMLWTSKNVYATDVVHSKDSLTVFCVQKAGVSFDAIKLKPGESKTVGCEYGEDVDINLNSRHWMQVFYCNHDNWLTIPDVKLLQLSERTDVKCVEP
jgi:hypothetical protein